MTNTKRADGALSEFLATAIQITRADFGTIHLLDRASRHLKIVTQSGFPQWWLDFFNTVEPGTAACGAALNRGTRVVVEDVEKDPIFVGTPALEMMRKAGVRAVQSTPINDEAGECLGVISTHYRAAHMPDERELALFDLLASQAAKTLQHERTAAELRKSEQRHRALIEAVAAVTWRCPPSGLNEEPQPSWMAFTGQTAEEMLGDGWSKAVHPDDVNPTAQRWQKAVTQSVPFHSEHRIRRHDGVWRWMRVSGGPLRDEHGQIVEWFGTCVDITDRKVLEEHLQSSERNLRAIFENGGVGMALLDNDRRFIAVNERLCEMLAYTREELLDMGPLDINHPEDREREAVRMAEAFDQPVPLYHAVIRSIRKDGEIIWVRVNATPIKNSDDEIVGAVSVVEDITTLKKAELSLIESEALVRLLFENSPIVLAVVDITGKAVLANAAARRLSPSLLIPARDKSQRDRWLARNPDGTPVDPENLPFPRVLRGETDVPSIEMQYTDDDGKKTWYLVKAAPVFDANGRLTGGFAAASEISDRKAMEELTNQAPKMNALAEISSGLASAGAERSLARLTRREAEILRSLVAGRTNKEVARELGLSPRTVEHHRANMMDKLEARHVSQLVSLWMTANRPS